MTATASVTDLRPLRSVGALYSKGLAIVARAAGSQRTFTISLLLIAAWAATGPLFHYSNSWQLAINTRTAILRFLTLLLIHHMQSRANSAAHAKLDELIRANDTAHDVYIGLENRPGETGGLEAETEPVARALLV